MDKDRIDGSAKQAKGAVKDAAGGLTGNLGLQAEGKIDKAAGKADTTVEVVVSWMNVEGTSWQRPVPADRPKGGPNNASTLLLYYIYEAAFTFQDSAYAATLTVVLIGLLSTLALIKFGYLDRRVHYQ